MKIKFIPLIISIILLTSCSPNSEEPYHKDKYTEIKEDLTIENSTIDINMTNIEKATYIADKIYEEQNSNILFSPLSLNLALSMVNEGANNKTKDEIMAWLSCDYSNYMEYSNDFNISSEFNGNNVFEIANSVWINENLSIKDDFVNSITSKYEAEIQNVNFSDDNTVNIINNWCNEKTNGLIPSILNNDSVSSSTASVLVNSIYFESSWRNVWSINEDYLEDFRLIDGSKIQIPYIYNEADLYYENSKAEAFSCYYNNGLTFIGILPKTKYGSVSDFNLSDLNIESLLKTGHNNYKSIDVKMPRLDFDTDINNIVNTMKELGYTEMFNPQNADFSNMVDTTNINFYIENIIQKCKIELDENGTKAAAATAISIDMNESIDLNTKEINVYLDRPFAFLIYDRHKQEIVFIGKVINPI